MPVANKTVDLARHEVLSAIYGHALPDEERHRKIAGWLASLPHNSVRAVRSDLRTVVAFQQSNSDPALPLQPSRMLRLLESLAETSKSKATVSRLVATMVKIHDVAGFSQCTDSLTKYKLKQIRRTDSRKINQARGLRLKGETHDVVEDDPMPLSLLRLVDNIPNDLAGLRDKALLSATYDAGLRRSEVVRVRVPHIEKLPNGEASLFIPRSKTDQTGEGSRAWLSARTVEYIDNWLTAAEITKGFVFWSLSYRIGQDSPLSEAALSVIWKKRLAHHLRRLESSGEISALQSLEVVRNSSSHSLRVGCDQDLFAMGVDIGAIMQGLRWSSPKQPLAYARHLAPSTSKLAANIRLARS